MTGIEPNDAWLVYAAGLEANGVVSVGGLANRIAAAERGELPEFVAIGKLREL